MLDENLTVFETIDNVAKGEVRLKIKSILGAFMFGGEASDKKVKVLSGGERSRLAMIKLLLEPVNLLILDEPTNHLDMPSKDVLKEAIKAFDGTAIVVSHDREFLDGLVSKIYEFGSGKVKEHIGGIYDFLRDKNINSLNQLDTAKTNTESQAIVSVLEPLKPSEDNRLSYTEHKEQQKKLRKLEKTVKDSEQKIENIEKRLKELDAVLCSPKNASNMELINEYSAIKKSLDEETEKWEKASEKLEKFDN